MISIGTATSSAGSGHGVAPRRGPQFVAVLLSILLLVGAALPTGAVAARQAIPAVVPYGQVGTAGPWQMQVTGVQTGDEAVAAVTAASPSNVPPAEGDQFVVVKLSVTNTGDRPHRLDAADFGLAGVGWTRRAGGLVAPDPALTGVVEPGATLSGHVALTGPADASALVLLYDSITLSGTWADAAFALSDGATIAGAAGMGAATEAGSDVGAPVAIKDAVATDDWQVSVVEVVIGDPVYDLYPDSDYRTTALGRSQAGDLGDADDDGAAGWVAVRVSVTYTGDRATGAYLSAEAFTLAQSDGAPLPNGLFLTAPDPEAEGWYAPGQAREGWVVFEIQVDWDTDAMRFEAHRTDADVRYLLIY